jgi:cytochrome P450
MLPRIFPFDPLAFGLDVERRFGDISHYQVGPLHVYQLNHPDLVRQILVEQPEHFHKPRLIKHAFGRFAGEGLLTSDGDRWRQQRKRMQPAFNHSHLATYGGVMAEYARQMIDSFRDGQLIEVNAEMARLTLRVVIKCLFGAHITQEPQDLGPLMVAVLDAANQRLNAVLGVPS